MVCSGASEQAISQWVSTFAKEGLGISKTVGDLAGPLSFALLMGTSRALYGKFGDRISQKKLIPISCIVCIGAYLVVSLSPIPALSLIGCSICGFCVGIMWPGTFSISSAILTKGGTAMFALLALGGDLGCSAGRCHNLPDYPAAEHQTPRQILNKNQSLTNFLLISKNYSFLILLGML